MLMVNLISFAAGLLVGVIYGLLHVRSPAPPFVALIGLLGILLGEQIIPVSKQLLAGASLSSACREARCAAHLFGLLPGHPSNGATTVAQPHFQEKAP
jgi:XapX domain-containing protein